MHLAWKALAWFNDQGINRFPTFDHLEIALIKQYGISEAKRQRYRSELFSMEQKDKTVQEITQLFESTWSLAYPNDQQEATQYKFHNYLRVLHQSISSMIGMQSPKTFEEAKDLAITIEAYLPRVPTARINSVVTDGEQKYLQEHQKHDQEIQKRDREIADLKRVLGQTRPPPPCFNSSQAPEELYPPY